MRSPVDERSQWIRQVARCRSCKRERAGLTRLEGKVYGGQPIGRPIHYCDECEQRLLTAVERPLQMVLEELASSFLPA